MQNQESEAGSDTLDSWQDHNRRGLSFATAADWEEAVDAFSQAVNALAEDSSEPVPQEPLAMVLSNLAQACFRAGHSDDALNYAQRAYSLRATLTGEDGLPAARARMDYAVMLAAVGRHDEAMTLVERAISTVERHVGDDDLQLAAPLENAARISMASGNLEGAEPYLLRLHSLLSLHGEPTRPADKLLARLASPHVMKADPAAEVEAEADAEALPLVTNHLTLQSESYVSSIETEPSPWRGWEDQPLRDAVALTDELLRSTPSGVPAIAASIEHVEHVEPLEPLEPLEHVANAERVEQIERVEQMEQVEPVALTTPMAQVAAVEPAQPTEPAATAETTEPAEPAEPAETVETGEPAETATVDELYMPEETVVQVPEPVIAEVQSKPSALSGTGAAEPVNPVAVTLEPDPLPTRKPAVAGTPGLIGNRSGVSEEKKSRLQWPLVLALVVILAAVGWWFTTR